MKISRTKSEDQWGSASEKDFDECRAGIFPLAKAGKLGALLLQYPASFKWSPATLESVESTLKRFYDYQKFIELRHRGWSENEKETRRLLEESDRLGAD